MDYNDILKDGSVPDDLDIIDKMYRPKEKNSEVEMTMLRDKYGKSLEDVVKMSDASCLVDNINNWIRLVGFIHRDEVKVPEQIMKRFHDGCNSGGCDGCMDEGHNSAIDLINKELGRGCMIELKITTRADFINKEDRDTARLALHNQDVFWDGSCVGRLECRHNTDDTTLGIDILMDKAKLPK